MLTSISGLPVPSAGGGGGAESPGLCTLLEDLEEFRIAQAVLGCYGSWSVHPTKGLWGW